MQQDRYIDIEKSDDYRTFMFVSEGRNGNMVKVVSFDETLGSDDVFNLALGTMLPGKGVDFETITNNGDRNKILATVAAIIATFMAHNPQKSVYITGSDGRRTILYQRAINYGIAELSETFIVYGDVSIGNEPFEFELFETGKNYAGFLIVKK